MVVSYMKGVGVLLVLLGSTWIFGLLYLVINSIYLAYTFTILNSLQGKLLGKNTIFFVTDAVLPEYKIILFVQIFTAQNMFYRSR